MQQNGLATAQVPRYLWVARYRYQLIIRKVGYLRAKPGCIRSLVPTLPKHHMYISGVFRQGAQRSGLKQFLALLVFCTK